MKINSVARKAIADKLASAIKREGLTHAEAAALFGMKSDRVSKFLNDKHRDLISDEYVEPFREWSNTGENLRVWVKKHNPGSSESVHQPTERGWIDNTNEPPGLEEAISEIREVAKKCNVSEEELRAIFTPMNVPSIQEIAELFDAKLAKQPDVLLATVEEIESKDRLEVILAVINEIKEMGFGVKISIRPKG